MMKCHDILKKNNKHEVDDNSSSTDSTSCSSSQEFSRSGSNNDGGSSPMHVKFALEVEEEDSVGNDSSFVDVLDIRRKSVLDENDIEDKLRRRIRSRIIDVNELPEDAKLKTFEAVIMQYEKEIQRVVKLNSSLTERVDDLIAERTTNATTEPCQRGRDDEDVYIEMIMNEEKQQKTINKLKKKLKNENKLVCQLGKNLKQATDKIIEVGKERDEWKKKYEALNLLVGLGVLEPTRRTRE